MMKKNIGLILLILSSLFLSCKKDMDTPLNVSIDKGQGVLQNQSVRKSTVNRHDVVSWLEARIKKSAKADKIIKIIDNIDIEKMRTENYNKRENLIVIPLKKQNFGREEDSSGVYMEFVLMVEDENGGLIEGDLAKFYPKDQELTELPELFFQTFFQDQKLLVDGKFQLNTLEDDKEFEMHFDNGNPVEFKQWVGRAPVVLPETTTCLDWFLVTTYYNPDLTTYSVWEYLYTTCSGGGGGGGGGTGGSAPAYPVTQQKVWNVRSDQIHYLVMATYNLHGFRNPTNSNANIFDNITPVGSSIIVNYATAGSPTDPWHANWAQYQNNGGVISGGLNAFAHVSGMITFPNQNYYMPISENTSWQASVVFH